MGRGERAKLRPGYAAARGCESRRGTMAGRMCSSFAGKEAGSKVSGNLALVGWDVGQPWSSTAGGRKGDLSWGRRTRKWGRDLPLSRPAPEAACVACEARGKQWQHQRRAVARFVKTPLGSQPPRLWQAPHRHPWHIILLRFRARGRASAV